MSGIQEVLVVIVIFLAILLLPRITTRQPGAAVPQPLLRHPNLSLSGRMRLAIAASLFWPTLTAAFIQPWQGKWLTYIYVGLAPVITAWCGWWVMRGYRKRR